MLKLGLLLASQAQAQASAPSNPELLADWDFANNNAGGDWTVSGDVPPDYEVIFANNTARFKALTTTPVLYLEHLGVKAVSSIYTLQVVISATVGTGKMRVFGFEAFTEIPNAIGTYTFTGLVANTSDLLLLRQEANVDMTIQSVSLKLQ